MNAFHLYLADFSEGIVKVGASRNADQRSSQIETYAGRQFGADMRNFVVIRALDESTWRQEEMAAIEAIKSEATPLPDHQEWFRGIGFGRAFELCLKAGADGFKPRRYVRVNSMPAAERPLTQRQAEVLQFVTATYVTSGRSPTMAEIAGNFACNPNASQCVVDAVVRKGFLKRLPGARGLIPTGKSEVQSEPA